MPGIVLSLLQGSFDPDSIPWGRISSPFYRFKKKITMAHSPRGTQLSKGKLDMKTSSSRHRTCVLTPVHPCLLHYSITMSKKESTILSWVRAYRLSEPVVLLYRDPKRWFFFLMLNIMYNPVAIYEHFTCTKSKYHVAKRRLIKII